MRQGSDTQTQTHTERDSRHHNTSHSAMPNTKCNDKRAHSTYWLLCYTSLKLGQLSLLPSVEQENEYRPRAVTFCGWGGNARLWKRCCLPSITPEASPLPAQDHGNGDEHRTLASHSLCVQLCWPVGTLLPLLFRLKLSFWAVLGTVPMLTQAVENANICICRN